MIQSSLTIIKSLNVGTQYRVAQTELIPTSLGIVQWPSDGLFMHESLDCALSFLIKSIITLYVSAHHHGFNFFSACKMEIEMCAMILYELQTAQRQEENSSHIIGRVRRGLILSWCSELLGLRRRELIFMMKLDPGDPSQKFLHRLLGCWILSNLIQLLILQGNWQWPRR
jgi:hypothetical protein